MDNQTTDGAIDHWDEQVRREALVSRERDGFNFVEITHFPKKIDGVSTERNCYTNLVC